MEWEKWWPAHSLLIFYLITGDYLFTMISFKRMRLERFSPTCSPESVTLTDYGHK